MRALLVACLLPAALSAAESAHQIVARAIEAVQQNQEQEVHWNWTAAETRTILGRPAVQLQKLPDVTVESVIRNDGKRCNAVLSWGDGMRPYLLGSDPDARCEATEYFKPAFDIVELLQSGDVRIASHPPRATIVTILPDKLRQQSPEFRIHCAASIRAAVELDPATSFPRDIQGEVTSNGCERSESVPIYYGNDDSVRTNSSFRKGAKFHLRFELQPDKFGKPEHSFWIRVEEKYEMPLRPRVAAMVYWGRRIPIKSTNSQAIVKEVRTTAREFGVEATILK
jgi:hypothetical protein